MATVEAGVGLAGPDRAPSTPDTRPPGGLECAGQLVDVRPGVYDWVYVRLDVQLPAIRADEPVEVWLHYDGGPDPEWLHLPPATSAGAPVARIPVTRRERLRRIRLPVLPGCRIVAMTLVRSFEDQPPTGGGRG